jgi:hypothetical protein
MEGSSSTPLLGAAYTVAFRYMGQQALGIFLYTANTVKQKPERNFYAWLLALIFVITAYFI